ncbi:hypothetical protein [Streptomyces noursei]
MTVDPRENPAAAYHIDQATQAAQAAEEARLRAEALRAEQDREGEQ